MRCSSSPQSSLWVVILLLATEAFGEHAEPPVAACAGRASSDSGPQPLCRVADRPILRKEDYPKGIGLVSELFPNLGRPFVESSFIRPLEMLEGERKRQVEPVPVAIAIAMRSKNEKEISAVMAIYFGTINEVQRDKIVTQVEAERTKEKEKTTEDRRDDKHVALLDRLYWAGKALQGVLVKDPEAQAFLKAFVGEKLDFTSGDFNKIQAQNETVLAKMKEARDGSKEAKQYLRDTLNRDALLPYIGHGLKGENSEAAAKLVDALSWKQKDNGPKFIDMVGPAGEAQRLFLGTSPQEIASALNAFGKEKGFTNGLAKERFEIVAREWYADSAGKLVAGVPPGATSSKMRVPPPPHGTSPTEPPKVSLTADQAKALIASNCVKCHTTTTRGDSPANFLVVADGKSYSLKGAMAKVQASATMAPVDKSVVERLRAWAAGS